jgi:Putative porin
MPAFRRAHSRGLATCLAVVLTCSLAQAQPAAPAERSELEQLRATTLALIQALVEQGLISRTRADALLRDAAKRAEPAQAAAAAPAASDTARPAGNVVRVPYIPETMKAQIKEDIRNDVLATAREEGWADARKFPPWLRGITLEGDVRVRAESDRFDSANLAASVYRAQVDSPAWSPDLTNTQTDRNRMTLRARLGLNARLTDDVTAGVRLSTGGTTNPSSESQTLGISFNRHAVGWDRAFVRWEPRFDLRLEAGRMAVPFYGTDLLWPDDLSVDGLALRGERNLASGLFAFATIGAFPLEEFALSGNDKWLYGAQIGADWAIGGGTQLKLGLAVYDFRRIEGVRETGLPPPAALAATTPYQLSQYPAAIRQKGNTLINLNDPTSTAAPVWGLASKFRPVNLTVGLSFSQLAPLQAGVTVDYVKNSGFDIADIRSRAGTSAVSDLAQKNTGLQIRAQVGRPHPGERGDWQVFAALRKFERDAWPDAFTDTTWNLGGTNYKGYSVGGSYFVDRNTSVGLRWTSTRNLDDGRRFQTVPGDPTSISGNLSSAPLKIDVIQLDLNAKF